MIGNVAEWCNDWYSIYKKDDQRDPVVIDKPSANSARVVRGSYGKNTYRISNGSILR